MNLTGAKYFVLMLETAAFGTLHYEKEDVIWFPHGLVQFQQERGFLAVERPRTKPVIFLQSIFNPKLFFLTLPLEVVDPHYEAVLLDEHRGTLGLGEESSPNLLSLAFLRMPGESTPTANLMNPLVINRATRTGIQLVRTDSRYSDRHPLDKVFA